MGAQPGTNFDSNGEYNLNLRRNGLDLRKALYPKASLGTPIQHIAAPEEVAAFVSHVASDSAGFVTGKVDFLLIRYSTRPQGPQSPP
jgi:NAD(P)-dependent dehydrogenase (short-subunit alcohol dehydrogenase family)